MSEEYFDLFEDKIPAEIEEHEEPKVEAKDGIEKVIPEKFKGKSLEDVIEIYQEMERAFGRQKNELGDLRKMTDKILLSQLESQVKQDVKPAQPVSVKFEDIVEDPATAVDKLVSPKIKELNDKLDDIDKEKRLVKFQSKFPDYQKDLSDDQFQKWVLQSEYRKKLFHKSDNYDIEAADELWSSWEERKSFIKAAEQASEAAKDAEKEATLKKAVTESSTTGASSRKFFKRSDIVRLRAEDPQRYNELAGEIRKAYAEGRVR